LDGLQDLLLRLLLSQLEPLLEGGLLSGQMLKLVYPALQGALLSELRGELFRVVPDLWPAQLGLDLGQPVLMRLKVKGASRGTRTCPAAPGSAF